MYGGGLQLENQESVISLRGVGKAYESLSGSFQALRGIDLDVRRGEFLAIVGKSGSGKSSLLNILDGIDSPSSGEAIVDGVSLRGLSQNRLALWRGRSVGVVFQFFQLMPTLTALENVMLPMDFVKAIPFKERKSRALALLDRVGVLAQAHKLPATLSGGEQQRVAIARAQANDPPIIVADEPTGNLDIQSAELVFRLFAELVEKGKTIVMVTHERDISRYDTRTLTLVDGRIVDGRVAEASR
jgi:putative ABC transport system ATP-binding protein